VLSFAPRAEADRVAARVRGVHRKLGVDDPEQLAWVHACLVDSFLAVGRAAGIRLGPGDADRYVAEQVVAAELAGVPGGRIVRDAAQLDAFVREIRPRLHGTRAARAAARFLVAPPLPVRRGYRLPARLGWSTVSSLALGLLPGWARRMYWLPPLPGAGITTATALHALRAAVATLPVRYREGPLYRDAQARAGLIPLTQAR
jgi:uncharacterized protein (DUF2236 family)